jgi:hypothetical protein
MKVRRALWIAVYSLVASGSLQAHHAFSAEFDAQQPVTLDGTLTKIEWTNPHSWFHVEVKKPDGTTEEWKVEAGTPNTLFRRGVTKETVPTGIVIHVDGYRAKDGSLRANGRNLKLPDGRTMFVGGEGGQAAEPAK